MKTEAAAEYVHPDTLTPWEGNPRINAHVVPEIARSIQQFGFAAPVVARKQDGMIIAGHTRWQAAKSLGMTSIPVRFMELTRKQAEALALADNRLGELADWDAKLLEQAFEGLQGMDDVSLQATGWGDEIAALYASLDGSAGNNDSSSVDASKPSSNKPTVDSAALQYRVVVYVDDAAQQASIVTELEQRGFKCQMLIS